MKRYARRLAATAVSVAALCAAACRTQAAIQGVSGTSFALTAKAGYVNTPDGNVLYTWGYALGTGDMQYPGPTLIANQGDTITVALSNELSRPVSIVFPGQAVSAAGGGMGMLTREAATGEQVVYTLTVNEPGTYLYHSGTQPDLQVEMGLVGALIVRPPAAGQAYGHPDSAYDREFLFLFTEMDWRIHDLVEAGMIDQVDTSTFFPVYWFINGRCAPDTMAPGNVAWLPNQPYNCMPRMYPGERLLLRIAGAGRDFHPFHHHGNNSLIIARDGRLLASDPGVSGPDLAVSDFTITVIPGGTADAIFEWTGAKLGWDAYGHAPGDPMEPGEYAPDHGKPFPVSLPDQLDLAFGTMWSGSPFLGSTEALPPNEGGFNPAGAFPFMWHSHNEKEMTTFDVFPGGSMTVLMVLAPGTPMM